MEQMHFVFSQKNKCIVVDLRKNKTCFLFANNNAFPNWERPDVRLKHHVMFAVADLCPPGARWRKIHIQRFLPLPLSQQARKQARPYGKPVRSSLRQRQVGKRSASFLVKARELCICRANRATRQAVSSPATVSQRFKTGLHKEKFAI